MKNSLEKIGKEITRVDTDISKKKKQKKYTVAYKS